MEEQEQVIKIPIFFGCVEKKTLVILSLLFVASSYYRSFQISLSLLAGGLIGVFSFWSLRRSIEGLIQKQQQSGDVLKTGFLLLKYPLLFAVIAFLILKTPLNIVAWVLGFLSLVLAIVWEGLIPSEKEVTPPSSFSARG